MGYDLRWADITDFDEWVKRQADEYMGTVTQREFRENFAEHSDGLFRHLESEGSYYRASYNLMAALRIEMKRQGMLGGDGIPAEKMEVGGHITPGELRAALAHVRDEPLFGPDHESPDPMGDWLGAHVPEGAVLIGGGRDSIAAMPPERWAERWSALLRFLRGAVDHGGVVL